MRYFIITAFGKDQPGIVAGITKILYEEGLNIEDSTMTRLNNEFAVMLVVQSDDNISAEELKKALSIIEKEKELTINVKEITDEALKDKKEVGAVYNIVVYGADKPGIVYNVAKLLADKNINISDLRTEKSNDLYVLISQVEFPPEVSEEEIEAELNRLKDEMNIDVSMEKQESVEM